MPLPDPTAEAAWARVLKRLEGADEPEAPTTAAPATGENLPAWWVAIAAVPTVSTAAPPTPVTTATATTPAAITTSAHPAPIATTSPKAYREPVSVELFRQRCRQFATNPIASVFR